MSKNPKIRSRLARVAAFGCLLPVVVACTAARAAEERVPVVQRTLERVLSAGAYYCAPRELALAQAHLEFARVELQQGEPSLANDHLSQALLNAQAAERLSPEGRCAGTAPAPGTTLPGGDGPDQDMDGVSDGADACPREAEDADGHADADGCTDLDNDRDGLADVVDQCPNEPAPPPPAPSSHGCPVDDADRDGVSDGLDRCPGEVGAAASEGCPRVKYRGLEVAARSLRLTEPVLFEDGTAAIRSVSFPLLDTVAEVLAEHPEITIEVQAHTDSQGTDRRNLELSKERAEAVERYLIERGVAASRLTAKGYGETRPIESNRTSQGRDINRRVELVRTDAAP